MDQQNFAAVFPEGLSPLAQADPEVFGIIKDEEERQWCANFAAVSIHSCIATLPRLDWWSVMDLRLPLAIL